MSKQRIDGVWVIVCDWVDSETGKLCDLGVDGEPKMFVDPDQGKTPDSHYQCGTHHGIIKQEDRPEFQLPEDHKLAEEAESTIVTNENAEPDENLHKIKLEGFKPDVGGRIWDGKKFNVRR
jgi:hypothetical protein